VTGLRPVKVLVIAGCGRSGSTLLTTVLGQIDGFLSIGELTRLWDLIPENRRPCSCARPLSECPFWGPVLGSDLTDPRIVQEAAAAGRRLLQVPLLRRRWIRAGDRQAFEEAADRYATIFGEVYRRVRSSAGCEVIVDNSKRPVHAYAVGRSRDCETWVLHLVRDSRAVALSTERHEGRGMASSARYWMAVNLKAEYFWRAGQGGARYMRARYEDFVAEPRATVERILRFLGEGRALDLFADDRTVCVGRSNHHVGAYPDRFPTGPLNIHPDNKWSTAMSRRDRLSVMALTWPLLLRYGYPTASLRPW
jgi:hypothetical protein